jgi:hypothetical protein
LRPPPPPSGSPAGQLLPDPNRKSVRHVEENVEEEEQEKNQRGSRKGCAIPLASFHHSRRLHVAFLLQNRSSFGRLDEALARVARWTKPLYTKSAITVASNILNEN